MPTFESANFERIVNRLLVLIVDVARLMAQGSSLTRHSRLLMVAGSRLTAQDPKMAISIPILDFGFQALETKR